MAHIKIVAYNIRQSYSTFEMRDERVVADQFAVPEVPFGPVL